MHWSILSPFALLSLLEVFHLPSIRPWWGTRGGKWAGWVMNGLGV